MINPLLKLILSPRELEVIRDCCRYGLFDDRGSNARKVDIASTLGSSHTILMQH